MGCDVDWAAVRAALSRAAPYVAMPNIKTLTNGWTTSVRMHELVPLTCLLGCAPSQRLLATRQFPDAGKDDTEHYLTCPRLWQLIEPRLSDEQWDPAREMGLKPVSGRKLRNVARVHFAYHFIKCADRNNGTIEERLCAARRLAYIAVP